MRTVVLDVNETLFSLDAVGDALQDAGLARTDLSLWFARVLRDGFAAAATGGIATFPDLAAHHARAIGAARGVDVDVDAVVAGFDRVVAHPDVAQGLADLADAGLRLVAYTNGSAPIVAGFLARAGLDALVDEALDVRAAGVWKPHPDAYLWVCDHLGVAPAEAAMVAVHPWDVAGAQATGMVGAWVRRDDPAPWPSWLPRPQVEVTRCTELAAALTS